jgi:hypothetical protein
MHKSQSVLRKAVFLDHDKHPKLITKRKVYNALYGAECWVLLKKQEKNLNTFHQLMH